MFIFCSWPVWYNVYIVYLSWHYPYQFQWRVMTVFFVRKYDLHSISLFFKHMQHVCASESIGFSPPLYCFTYIEKLLWVRIFRKILFFFLYICMYCKNTFVFAPFYLLKLKNKICFLLALIKLCITFNTPKRSKYLHNLRKYWRPSLSYCSYRRIGSMVVLPNTRKSNHTWIC